MAGEEVRHQWLKMAQTLQRCIQKTRIPQICQRVLAAQRKLHLMGGNVVEESLADLVERSLSVWEKIIT